MQRLITCRHSSRRLAPQCPAFSLVLNNSVFVRLLVMLAKNGAKTLDEAITYALPRVGKASINIKQQQWEAIQCAYNGKDAFIQLATNWLWQVALLQGLALHHRLQTWDRLQHGIGYITTSFTDDWPSTESLYSSSHTSSNIFWIS